MEKVGDIIFKLKKLSVKSENLFGGCGAEGIRTPDLLNAIQALSQLSYSPRLMVKF